MNNESLYPENADNQLLQWKIARNMALLDLYNTSDKDVSTHVKTAKLLLSRLSQAPQITEDDAARFKKSMNILRVIGVPVIVH